MTYTQEQLEGMSDGELNGIIDHMLALEQIKAYEEVGDFTPFEYLELEFVPRGDYCNNWEDMGPLIVEAKIDIRFNWDEINKATCISDDGLCSVIHDNPLRAAAIVYILVKQEESKK